MQAIPVEVKHFAAGLIDQLASKEVSITPAALSAFASSDIENFIIASTPGGIEAQEARGQRDLCGNSAKLPIDGGRKHQAQFEAMGIKFETNADDIFINVELPEGWRIAPTDHSMWSKLLDDQSRERASIFYKAAFYDRSAHVSLCRRYSCGYRPVGGYGEGREKKAFEGYVSDYTGDLFVTSPTAIEPEFDRDEREPWDIWIETRGARYEEAKAWLAAKFPEHENPLAYWDLERD